MHKTFSLRKQLRTALSTTLILGLLLSNLTFGSGFNSASIKSFSTAVRATTVEPVDDNIESANYYDDSMMLEEAEQLYKKINNFLLEYKDFSPEEFDDACRKYMAENLNSINLLNKKDFEENSKDSIILYRGLNEKSFSDDFKNGIVYIPSNTYNVRGIGIYTTTSLECAWLYSDKSTSKTILKMLMPKEDVKILENEHLEKLKEIICRTHPEEFGTFSIDNKQSFIFDSIEEILEETFNKFKEKIKQEQIEDPNKMNRLFNETMQELTEDPIFQYLKANRQRYFKENKAAVFYNSGLLANLLGFDVLHSIDYLRDDTNKKEEEYLIVNSKILSVLKD